MAELDRSNIVIEGRALKSCPFCGDPNVLTDAYYDESAVRCQKCNATGPVGNYSECQRLWNKRIGQDGNNE